MSFSDKPISLAALHDLPAIEKLLNIAYRGETARQGWTSEAHLIGGETRTTLSDLEQLLEQPGSVFLKISHGDDIIGCVNLQQQGDKVYLGMLAVSPLLQGGGTGKKLLAAAEEYAGFIGCPVIYMNVISVRHELVNWYKRHGYTDTGERKPFYEDGITGRHLQPLEFIILEKTIARPEQMAK